MRLTYIGYSEKMIQCLLADERLTLVGIITKPGVISPETKMMIADQKIDLYEMNEKADICRIEDHIRTDKVLIYKFGYIIPRDIIARHDFYNIHPGSIENNRGAHPLRWTILLGDEKTWLTLYQITGIDEGNVICEEEIEVGSSDYIELDHKLDAHLEKVLDRYVDFIQEGCIAETVRKERGTYRPKVQEADYTIDIENDTYDVIKRKIRAVKDFGGAVILLDQMKYRVREIVTEDEAESEKGKSVPIELKKNGKRYVLICEEYVWK